ncbi:MAG TPA: universal stress protein [Aquamicrobium sp.]|jgi:nucleotide-binding universal stress UspA family protein|nr:universal stress protein [Aquamicrobium sp.]
MSGAILCCVNDSVHARRAVEVAVEMAAGLGRGLTFLLVNRVRPASGHPPIKAISAGKAKEVLDIAMRYAEAHGVREARPALAEAKDVAEAILRFASETGASDTGAGKTGAGEHAIGHIVVGTGNPPFIGRLLLGSVSEAVVAGAACSVTVAR